MVSAYGMDVVSLLGMEEEHMRYELWCALYLSIPRIRLQKSWDIMTGLRMANSRKPLPSSVYDAQAISPELTEKLQEKGNKSRYQQNIISEMKARIRW
jgi:hypothetical protein